MACSGIPKHLAECLLVIVLLAACSQHGQILQPEEVEGAAQTATIVPDATSTSGIPSPTPTATHTSSPVEPPTSPIETSTTIPSEICSPLDGLSLAEVPGTISNPYSPPQPGSDDPHQGVDLADRLPGSQVTRKGRLVRAALSGRVAGMIADRFPYGNAVLVEVPLKGRNGYLSQNLPIPTALSDPLKSPSLTCPEVDPPYLPTDQRSLYLLYAHLLEPPAVQIGQEVQCGDRLGAVGDSGNALNPHLHLEVRVGPEGAVFPSFGHYDNRVSAEEMGLYCLWRVSGIFQVVDPMTLLSTQP